MKCPKCGSQKTYFDKKNNCFICKDCNEEFTGDRVQTVFVSYGHDEHEYLVREISQKLREYPEIQVWIDFDCLYGSSEWEAKIEE